MDRLKELEGILWHNLPDLWPGAVWSPGQGTWALPWGGRELYMSASRPSVVVDRDTGESLGIVSLLADLWQVPPPEAVKMIFNLTPPGPLQRALTR